MGKKRKQSRVEHEPGAVHASSPPEFTKRLGKRLYESELERLHEELVKLQSWIQATSQKVLIIFEGRDAAGKGGTIKRITEPLNPRVARVVALSKPTERERGQWYFQRYVEHLPAPGELAIFDRSWYNRAGVEQVMGFATEAEVREFLYSVPKFERMLSRSGIRIIKYWFSVSPDEQERRFQARIDHTTKRWKISEMDIASRAKWDDYSRAKDEMFAYTDIKECPWYVVESDDKRRARLNCISHLLSLMPYKDHTRAKLKLPARKSKSTYLRPEYADQTIVPRIF